MSERPDARVAICLRCLPSADQIGLSATYRDAALLL
jgi:hypothetical protein